jgi:hypothetical protein
MAVPVFVLLGCAVPGLMIHTYSFRGRLVDEMSGRPLVGVKVVLEAQTPPYPKFPPKRTSGTTTSDGTFQVEIPEMFCHTIWICPPLGTLGGSLMNEISEVRLLLSSEDRPDRDLKIPVDERHEVPDHGYRIEHTLPVVKVPRN